jgi:hypothetical protein
MITFASRLLLGAAVVTTGLLATPVAAQAALTGCTLKSGLPNDTVTARCTSGTGQVRAVVECAVFPPGRDPVITQNEGAWVGVGETSTTSCPGGPIVWDAWYELRESA